MNRLEGKVAILTGSGSGMGRATARLFASEGALVACVDINGGAAEETAEMIANAGGTAIAITADVTQSAPVRAMAEETTKAFGHVDILHNHVGGGVKGRLHELSEEDWDAAVARNLTSVFLCSKAILPQFLEQGSGCILNTASSYGILVTHNNPAYCATKAAVIHLTKQMAFDYGPEIRVNCVCPGAIASPPMLKKIEAAPDPAAELARLENLNVVAHRLGQPEEVANALLFLASEESSFCTGIALVVDGGQTLDA